MNCGLRMTDCGFGTDLRRDTCPAGLLPRACAGRLYKRTQLAGANHAKRTQFPPTEIPQRSIIPPFHYSSPMRIVRNEPNWAGRPSPQRTKRAKRTQFPWWSAAAPEGEMRKQTQFWPLRPSGAPIIPVFQFSGVGRGQNVQNEPNLADSGQG